MYARFRKFLDVRPGEGIPLLYTFLYVAVAVGSFLLAKAIRNGLFLQVYGAEKLVYVYVAVPLALMLVVPVYGAVATRIGTRKVVTSSLLFLCANVFLFWWGLTYSPRPWLSAAFYVWVNCYGVIAPVQAWSFANAVFDTRQARRLFGLVGSGASVGAMAGGILVRLLIGTLGTVNLLLVLAIMIAGTAVIVNVAWHVRRRDAERAWPEAQRGRREVPFLQTLRLIARQPYLRRIAMLVILVAITTQWTQFQFQSAAQARFTGDADRLTRFFGDFNSAMGVVALLVQIFATGPALKRFGLGVTVLLLPLMLGLGVFGILVTGTLWAVLLTNAFDQGLRFSVDKASFELLYLPIASSIRNHVKTTIDLIVNRLADALGGVLLGLATTGFAGMALAIPGFGLGLRGIAAVTLVFIGCWIAVAVTLRHGYVDAIRDSISRHRLDTDRLSRSILDRETSDLLVARLSGSEPKEILYALDLFRMAHRGATHPAVSALLSYPSPDVRRRAVTVLDEAGDVTATHDVEALLNDPDPGVRAEALVFLAHHADIDPLERITTLTDFESFSVQACLVAFLGRPSSWQNLDAARVILAQMIGGEGPNGQRARLEAARLLAQLPEGFESELSGLLEDEDQDVVLAALAATAHPDKAALVDHVVARLSSAPMRDAAGHALAGMGPSIVPRLRKILEDRAWPLVVAGEVPRILSVIGGLESQAALVDNLFEPDVTMRSQIVAGLSRLHAHHPELDVDRQTIEMALTAEVMGHYRSYQILGTLGPAFESNDPVAQGLRHAIEQEQERILRLLDPLLPDQDMKSVYLALRSQTQTLRANALELLDNVLSPQLRELIVPLFDGQVTVAERVVRANKLVGASVDTPEQAALAMLASEDPWLKACGVHAAGALHLEALRPQLLQLTRAVDPLLRQTARAALIRLETPEPTSPHKPAAMDSPVEMEASISEGGGTFGVG